MSKKRAKEPKAVAAKALLEISEGIATTKVSTATLYDKKPKVTFRTRNQEAYWNLIDKNQITFCTGAAGTGKSHISVLKAIDMLFTGQVDKIFITTPVVEADEKLGFLPGGVDEKLDPYTYSTMYLFEKILPKRKVELLKERGAIKIMPLAYMRGINIDNAVVIAEEMQNCTPRQMKTFLTRIGSNAKFIISGDLEQQDRYHANQKNTNGLYDAMQKFSRAEYKDIGVFQFDNEDIVRNPLIAKILEQYKDV